MRERFSRNRVFPVSRDHTSGAKNKIPLAKLNMRDPKPRAIPDPAAPQNDIEIEHTVAPAPPAPAAEFALHPL